MKLNLGGMNLTFIMSKCWSKFYNHESSFLYLKNMLAVYGTTWKKTTNVYPSKLCINIQTGSFNEFVQLRLDRTHRLDGIERGSVLTASLYPHRHEAKVANT